MAVALKKYIQDALVHLANRSTYEFIFEEEAQKRNQALHSEIFRWTVKFRKEVGDDTVAFLRAKLKESKKEPFGFFYLLYKLHKTPLKTRPVCSDYASTPHALGIWVNQILQPIAKSQQAYFKDSFSLKDLLELIILPMGKRCSLFTFDAISMYTNINTDDCLKRLSKFLEKRETQARFNYPCKALVQALIIVMKNNRMTFGDVFVQQLAGVAMGMSPAPPIANLYVALHESTFIPDWLTSSLFFYKRFIDDGIGIWIHNENDSVDKQNWDTFQLLVNNGGLTWEFTELSQEINFMDMTINISGDRIETNLSEKPLALHLYIPPQSCHPPNGFGSLVNGMTLRIYYFCSRDTDIDFWLKKLYGYLRDRGFQPKVITHSLQKAISNATSFLHKSKSQLGKAKASKSTATRRKLILHLQYHPNDPPAATIQKVLEKSLFNPKDGLPLNQLTNFEGDRIQVDGMLIAYSRAPNIGNLLSYRKINKRLGPKVSSFL